MSTLLINKGNCIQEEPVGAVDGAIHKGKYLTFLKRLDRHIFSSQGLIQRLSGTRFPHAYSRIASCWVLKQHISNTTEELSCTASKLNKLFDFIKKQLPNHDCKDESHQLEFLSKTNEIFKLFSPDGPRTDNRVRESASLTLFDVLKDATLEYYKQNGVEYYGARLKLKQAQMIKLKNCISTENYASKLPEDSEKIPFHITVLSPEDTYSIAKDINDEKGWEEKLKKADKSWKIGISNLKTTKQKKKEQYIKLHIRSVNTPLKRFASAEIMEFPDLENVVNSMRTDFGCPRVKYAPHITLKYNNTESPEGNLSQAAAYKAVNEEQNTLELIAKALEGEDNFTKWIKGVVYDNHQST